MRYIILTLFNLFLLTSCNKPIKFNNVDIQPRVKKILLKEASSTYDFKFKKSISLILASSINNMSEQMIEKIILIPSIKLEYKNDLKYQIPIDSIIIDTMLNSKKRIFWRKEIVIEELNNFKKEIFFHDVETASISIKIIGNNSIGYNSQESDEIEEIINITKQWKILQQFLSEGLFPTEESLFSNYTKQFNNSMKEFNIYNENSLNKIQKEYNLDSFDKFLMDESKLWYFEKYQKKLFSSFIEDYKKINPNLNFHDSWNQFEIHIDSMYYYRAKMTGVFREFELKKDSLVKKMVFPRKKIYANGQFHLNDNFEDERKKFKTQKLNALYNLSQIKEINKKKFEIYKSSYIESRKKALQFYQECHNQIVTNLKIENFVDNFAERLY